MFDDVLLRFCTSASLTAAEAQTLATVDPDAAESKLQRAWIVLDEYRSAWEMPSLAKVLSHANARAALADAAESKGLNWKRIWAAVEAIVSDVLSVPALELATTEHYDLVRFDMKLDVHGKPWRETMALEPHHAA
eukprot:3189064-Prymnesium_polylepis.1